MSRFETWVTLTACLLLLVVAETPATTIGLAKAHLTAKARGRIEKLACIRPHGVKAESIQGYYYPTGRLLAHVRCEPHAKYEGRSIFMDAECDDHRLGWECTKQWPNIFVELRGTQVPLRLDNVTPEEAVGTADYLASLPPYPGGRLTPDRLRGLWRFEKSAEFTITVYTSGNFYEVERRCSTEGCGYEITSSGLVDY